MPLPGAEQLDSRAAKARQIPPEQRSRDVRDFLAAYALQQEAGEVLFGGGAAAAGAPSEDAPSEDEVLVAGLQYVAAMYAVGGAGQRQVLKLVPGRMLDDSAALMALLAPLLHREGRRLEPTALCKQLGEAGACGPPNVRLTVKLLLAACVVVNMGAPSLAHLMLRTLDVVGHAFASAGGAAAPAVMEAQLARLQLGQRALRRARRARGSDAGGGDAGGRTIVLRDIKLLALLVSREALLRTVGRSEEAWDRLQLGAWMKALVEGVAEIEPDHPRSWELLAEAVVFAAAKARMRGSLSSAAYQEQMERATKLYAQALECARRMRSAWHMAGQAFSMVHIAAAWSTACLPPGAAAAAMTEAEAAYARCRGSSLPWEWMFQLKKRRQLALAVRPALELHVLHSPSSWREDLVASKGSEMLCWLDSCEELQQRGRTCYGCGQHSISLQACSGCRHTQYRSRECQPKDWKRHKSTCKAAQHSRQQGHAAGPSARRT